MPRFPKIILATIVLMLLSSVVYGADWKSIGKDTDNNEWFYDTQSISQEQDTIKVWTKIVLSDKAKSDFLRKFEYGSSISLGGEHFDKKRRADILAEFQQIKSEKNIIHRIDRYEIDCVKNRIKVMSSAWFDSGENVIHNENSPHPFFKDIAPDSFINKLVETVCKMGR